MYERKIDKLLHGLHNAFGIADDILIAGSGELGRDHDEAVDKVLEICRKDNLRPNKEKYHFRCTSFHSLERSYHEMAQAQIHER